MVGLVFCSADLYGRPFFLARASDARPTTFGRRTLWGRLLWSAILFGQGRAMLALLQMVDLRCGADLYGRPFYLARASDARTTTNGRPTLWGRPLWLAILFGQGERCSPYYIWSTYSVGPTFMVGHFIWPGRAMLALLHLVDVLCGADLYGWSFYLARASDARPTTNGRPTLWGRPLLYSPHT